MKRMALIGLLIASVSGTQAETCGEDVSHAIPAAAPKPSIASAAYKVTKAGWDFYISPLKWSIDTATLGTKYLKGSRVEAVEIKMYSQTSAKAFAAVVIFGVAAHGCVTSMSFLEVMGQELPKDTSKSIVIFSGFTQNASAEKGYAFWHPLAKIYIEKRAEMLRKRYPKTEVFFAHLPTDFGIQLKRIYEKNGPISYLEAYGHGQSEEFTLDDGWSIDFKYLEEKEKPYSKHIHGERAAWAKYFADDATVALKQCFVGSAESKFMETLKNETLPKNATVSGSQVATVASPFREPMEMLLGMEIPAEVGLASDYLTGPLRIAVGCPYNYWFFGKAGSFQPFRSTSPQK